MPHRTNFAVTLPSFTSRLYLKSVHLIIIIRRGEGFEFCIHVSLLFCNNSVRLRFSVFPECVWSTYIECGGRLLAIFAILQ